MESWENSINWTKSKTFSNDRGNKQQNYWLQTNSFNEVLRNNRNIKSYMKTVEENENEKINEINIHHNHNQNPSLSLSKSTNEFITTPTKTKKFNKSTPTHLIDRIEYKANKSTKANKQWQTTYKNNHNLNYKMNTTKNLYPKTANQTFVINTTGKSENKDSVDMISNKLTTLSKSKYSVEPTNKKLEKILNDEPIYKKAMNKLKNAYENLLIENVISIKEKIDNESVSIKEKLIREKEKVQKLEEENKCLIKKHKEQCKIIEAQNNLIKELRESQNHVHSCYKDQVFYFY